MTKHNLRIVKKISYEFSLPAISSARGDARGTFFFLRLETNRPLHPSLHSCARGERDMATEEEMPAAAAAAAAAAPAGGGGDDAEMRDAASPSESDSDSSDSDDEGAAGADELRIQALEQALKEQPLDYETHVQVSFALHLPRCHGALGF